MSTSPKSNSSYDFMTLREVGTEFRCSRSMVNTLIRRFGLPAIKVGGKVLVQRADLAAWIANRPGFNIGRR